MSGETEKSVSGWTVDTLRHHILDLQDAANKRYEQRFDAQEKAVSAALAAAKEAVSKAETAIGERLKLLNEFRQQSADRDQQMISRVEVEAMFKATTEKISDLQARMDRGEGRSAIAYPAFEKLINDTASLTQSRSERAGERGGKLSQQQMMMMIVSLIVAMFVIGGFVVGIAYAIRG